MIKNCMRYCILALSMFISLWSVWQWLWMNDLDSSFPYRDPKVTSRIVCDWYTDLWNCVSIKEDEKRWWEDTILRQLLRVFGLDTSKGKDLKFLDYAKAIMNMLLWLIAFIALMVTLYTFYMILFSDNEAWIKKAKQTLVGILVALGIIGLAWIIVSFIFRWYQYNWKHRESAIESGNVAMAASETHDGYKIYLTI